MYFEIDKLVRENKEHGMFRSELHRFAKEVLRPAAEKLDKMDAREVAQHDSPYFEVIRKMKKNGYHRVLVPEEYGGEMLGPLEFNTFCEELAWGSMGLTTACGVNSFPAICAALIGSPEAIEEVVRPFMEDEEDKYHGCWAVMDPDRGSDYITAMDDPHPEEFGMEGFFKTERDGDEWVLNGTKSYWTSSGPCANWALVHPILPPHSSPQDIGAAMVPLTLPGVTVSPPIDKLGMRDDPQGEIIFENVRIPNHYMLAQAPEFGRTLVKMLVSCTSVYMGGMFLGVARAAFEETLKYCKERIQGKKPIIDHQLTRIRLYKMFEGIETARAFLRAATKNVFEEIFQNHTYYQSTAHAFTAQAYCKNTAFQIAHDGLQLFGGAGILKEMPIEKLFRDARVGLIMDGCSEMLSLEAVADMLEEDLYSVD